MGTTHKYIWYDICEWTKNISKKKNWIRCDWKKCSDDVKDEVYKCYPEARRAHMKDGGNFPYLSRPEEVNLYLQVQSHDGIRGLCLEGFEMDLGSVI